MNKSPEHPVKPTDLEYVEDSVLKTSSSGGSEGTERISDLPLSEPTQSGNAFYKERQPPDAELYYHKELNKWATPHPESIKMQGGAHAGILYRSEPMIRTQCEREYWDSIDRGDIQANRGPGGTYTLGNEGFYFQDLSEHARKLFRWTRYYATRRTLEWIAIEEGIDLEATLVELREKGAVEDVPERPGDIRGTIRRL